jgi:SAM-dependent methyltransferase
MVKAAAGEIHGIKGIPGLLRRVIGWERRQQIRRYFIGTHQWRQWGRIVMDSNTETLVRELSFAQFDVLEISGHKWRSFGFKSYRDASYPDYDVSTMTLPDMFDLIIAEQVLEHLLWPYRAIRNVAAMLKPGGYFLVTTPFLVRIHEEPNDCTRWSETGLKHFLAEGGFALGEIRTGSWGNLDCVVANLNRRREWIKYKPWKHSLRNEPEFPIHVWALARKL